MELNRKREKADSRTVLLGQMILERNHSSQRENDWEYVQVNWTKKTFYMASDTFKRVLGRLKMTNGEQKVRRRKIIKQVNLATFRCIVGNKIQIFSPVSGMAKLRKEEKRKSVSFREMES